MVCREKSTCYESIREERHHSKKSKQASMKVFCSDNEIWTRALYKISF